MRNLRSLLQYILKRILLLFLSFFIIFTICFFLIRLLPNNYQVSVGKDPEMYERLNAAYGWDKPILVQYGLFLKNLFYPFYRDENGVLQEISRFGYSWKISYMERPDKILFERLPPTMLVNLYSMIFSVPLGILLGVFMALKKNKWQDHVLSVVIMVVISVPSFVYAFLIQYVFGFQLHLFPIVMPPLEEGMTWFSLSIQRSLVLPVLAMSFGTIAGFARFTRAELTEVMSQNFMTFARTKGFSKWESLFSHGMRNAMVVIFPMLLGEFISISSGSVIIEQVFSIPGVGRIFLDSITNRDYDLFLFVGMFYTFIGLVGSLVIDISYGIIDPRIRMGGGKNNE